MIDLQSLYSHIEKEISALKRPSIIGVNGAITSGKTVLAENLSQYLEESGYHVQLIHIDDFHNPKSIRLKENSPEYYLNNAIDANRFSSLISAIKTGPAYKKMSVLDMGTDAYTKNEVYETRADSIVIVEGVLLYKPEIASLFDYKIFLDIDEKEILPRGSKRDAALYGESILKEYENLYIPVHRLYMNNFSPEKQSDMIIDNNDVHRPLIMDKT